ncbi:MAG: hypothetical protein R3250_04030 [Melioribacteraceae bacterium]|nr:hypothetical protein [Melioribacteraceae bacterium]
MLVTMMNEEHDFDVLDLFTEDIPEIFFNELIIGQEFMVLLRNFTKYEQSPYRGKPYAVFESISLSKNFPVEFGYQFKLHLPAGGFKIAWKNCPKKPVVKDDKRITQDLVLTFERSSQKKLRFKHMKVIRRGTYHLEELIDAYKEL